MHQHEKIFHDIEAFMELDVILAKLRILGELFFREGFEEVLVILIELEALF